MGKQLGAQTVKLENPVSILSSAAIVGQKEKDGPLGDCFDIILEDAEWNENTWEKTESKMQREAVRLAAKKAELSLSEIRYVFAGDLLNQCIGAGFGLRELNIPFFGIYGACSTMIEGISLASMLIDGGFAHYAAAVTSSHFCTAERQYRMPLEYGGQRPPTAQWTVTGAGSAVLGTSENPPYITHITTGKIMDMGIKDANNMGGAMAPAAHDTLLAHFKDTGRSPNDYDLIITGDLGAIGGNILKDFMETDGFSIRENHKDCGCMIFNPQTQDVHAGGSGCGCVASVLCGHLIPQLQQRKLNRILVIGTGALLSPTSGLQGETVPGIAHLVAISNEKE